MFTTVEIKPEMTGHYLGEFAISYIPTRHGKGSLGKNAYVPRQLTQQRPLHPSVLRVESPFRMSSCSTFPATPAVVASLAQNLLMLPRSST